MDPMIKKALKDKTTWYACTGKDGTGDKAYAPGVDVKCKITGKGVLHIANIRADGRLIDMSKLSGPVLESKYVVYFDRTLFNIQAGDDVVVEGMRLPVKSAEPYRQYKNGSNSLGVMYV